MGFLQRLFDNVFRDGGSTANASLEDLSPEELERSQGWYAVQEASSPHWKYFWFD